MADNKTNVMRVLDQKKIAYKAHSYPHGEDAVDGVTVYGDFSGEHADIVALNIRDIDSGAVSDALFEDYGVATRPGAHCAPRLHEALGTKAQGAVRFSFSWFTTEQEIDAAVAAVKSIAGEKE